MAGDYFQQKTTGQKFQPLKAKLHNSLLRAVADHERDTLLGANPGGDGLPGGLIYIQNNSGSAVDAFGVLGVSGVAITETDNLSEFLHRCTFTGATPSNPEHLEKFVITWEPIAAGAIGKAFAFGIAPVKVTMNSSSDKWADIVDGDTTMLTSGSYGGAQIFYVGPPDDDGVSWAQVRLGFGLNLFNCPKNSGTGSGS
jgi:hypothetical protein